MKIIEYTLVSGDFHEIIESVNDDIKDGWQPFGAVTMIKADEADDIQSWYVQAMVKYGDL